jgi:beta-lactamase family protein
MRRVSSFIAMIALISTSIGGRVFAFDKHMSGAPKGSAAPIKTMGAGKDKTDVDVFGFNSYGAIKNDPVGAIDWNLRWPGYNIIRSFTNSKNQKLLFLLNGNTGEAETFEIKADGSIGNAPWWTGKDPLWYLRCTSAEIIKDRDQITLVTQDSFTGKVRQVGLDDDGAPTGGLWEVSCADMQDKNLFQVYAQSDSNYQMIGVDTWSGNTVVYGLNMQKVADASWTRGWTSLDSLYLNSRRYRLLYKAEGDPFKKPEADGNPKGRLLFQEVGANGVDAQIILDTAFADNYSTARFVEFPGSENGVRENGVIFYRRTTGEYSLYRFSPQTGLGNLIDTGNLSNPNQAAAPPYIDLQPCVTAGKSFLAFVSADNAKPLGYAQANQYGQIVYDWMMTNKTVGYQFILAQSGRIMYRQAWGKLKIDDDPSAEVDMTTHTQMEIGSAGKMITTMSVLKLAETGKIDLASPISNFVPAGQVSPGSWALTTPVINLLTHTTGVMKAKGVNNNCSSSGVNSTVNCQNFFNTPPNLTCTTDAQGNVHCPRSYNGANLQAARKIIEAQIDTGNPIITSEDITQKTHKLWADSIGLETLTCRMNANAYYYGPCVKGSKCYTFEGQDYLRKQQVNVNADNWLSLCSSSNWYASSREMMAFLNAIRYRLIIKDPAFTDLLLNTELADSSGAPGSTALAWEPPVEVNGEKVLGKAGTLIFTNANRDRLAAARAYITRMPDNCDVVVQLNTQFDDAVPDMVNNAYRTVAP